MDVGDLSNAAALAGSGATHLGPPGFIINTTNTGTNISNTTTEYANAGWWTPSSSIVTAPANADVMNQLCRVCGEPAAGFHFGAFTCEGCKSFFGRTYNNLGSISECKNGGVCVINKKNRTACKACRLRKCLMVGMSKSGSRYGRRSNWFKIHCLLQEQSHQAQQARLKDPTNKSPFEKVLSSLDAANNNTNNNFAASSGTNSLNNQTRYFKNEDSTATSPTRSVPRPEMLHHDLLRPEVTRFPLWRGPSFFHPALSHMQLLNSPFFPFQQRFVMPYVNQVGPQLMPVTSLTSSSSDSASPRSTPSPHRLHEETSATPDNSPGLGDKSLAFLRSLGPEQEEPMDLSKKNCDVDEREDDLASSDESVDEVDKREDFEVDGDVIPGEVGPPLDLTWKT